MWVPAACLVAVLCYMLYRFIEKQYAHFDLLSKMPGPAPKHGKYWLLGDALDLAADKQHKWERMYATAKGLFVHWILLKPVVMLCHPDHIKHVIQSVNFDDKDALVYGLLAPLIGKGLIVSGGEHWKIQRQVTEPAFHRKIVNLFVPRMEAAAQQLAEKLGKVAAETPWVSVDLDKQLICLTLDIIGQTAFGVDFGFQETTDDLHGTVGGNELVNSFQCIFRELFLRITNPFRPVIGYTLLGGYRGLKDQINYSRSVKYPFHHSSKLSLDCQKYVRNFMLDIIKLRKDERERGGAHVFDEERERVGNITLLDMLLAADMKPEHILDECMTFLVAGHDTCAHTLAWALYLIATHYDVEQKLLEELRTVCGFKTESGAIDLDLSPEKLSELKYLWCIIQETMRLYPPVAIALRTCTEPDRLGDFEIPSNTCVGLFFYALHRNPALWTNPDSFLPERFYTAPPAGTYGPFSWGKRACIGQYFATVELKVVVATLVWKYHLEADSSHTVGVVQKLTNQPMHGLKFFPRPRR